MITDNPRDGTRLLVLPTATDIAHDYIGQIVVVDDEDVDFSHGCVIVLADDGERFPLCDDEWQVLDH